MVGPTGQLHGHFDHLDCNSSWCRHGCRFKRIPSRYPGLRSSEFFDFGSFLPETSLTLQLTPLGAATQGFAYVLMCWGGPYPLFVIAYFFIGLGLGWQDAQVNSMASRMPNNTVVMFMAHAIYGLGATVSPFVSTAFLQQAPDVFYYFFIVSLGLAVVTLITLIVVYQGRTEDQVVGKARWVGGQQIGMEKEEQSSPSVPLPDAGAGMMAQEEHIRADEEASVEHEHARQTPASEAIKEERTGASKLRAIFTSPRALCMAFYIFAYVSE